MLDQKIERYPTDISIAKELKKKKYADQEYYNELIAKYEKLLNFNKQIKKKSESLKISNTSLLNNV